MYLCPVGSIWIALKCLLFFTYTIFLVAGGSKLKRANENDYPMEWNACKWEKGAEIACLFR